MATIITKNSSTAAAVPTAGQLVQGELAVNVTDKKVYTKDASSAVVKLVGSLGNQESNNVTITGGTITGTTVSGSANINVQRFSGDGTTTVFTLSSNPVSENNTQIYINGVYQQKDTYTVVGTTLTFSEAPVADTDNIEVVTTSMQAVGTTTSDLVSYTPAGTGAVASTVQSKLRETVSVKDFGAVGDGVTDDTAAIQAAITSASGRPLYFPAGIYIITSTLTYAPASYTGAFGPGIQVYGDGIGRTIIDNRANGPAFSLTTASTGVLFRGALGGNIEQLTITRSVATSGGVGIYATAAFNLQIRQVHIIGMSSHGIHIPTLLGDNDGSNMLALDHVRIENCAEWGIKADGNSGFNETSFIHMRHVFIQGCGTANVAYQPPSGGMAWKGQILTMQQCGFTLNENCALWVPGQAGLANTIDIQNTAFENNRARSVFCRGISTFKARNIQIYNNDGYTSTVGCEFEGDSFVIRQIDIDGVVVRATSGNNPYTAFKISGTNTDLNTCRVRRVVWDNFDYTGQTRFDGWQFDVVPKTCDLVVQTSTQVLLRPKTAARQGKTVPLRLRGGAGGAPSTSGEWVEYQVPGSGLTLSNSGLSASTRYYVYLWDNNGFVQLEASTTAFTADTASGYLVKTGDATRLYVGSVETDASSLFKTTAGGWLNPLLVPASQVGTYNKVWVDSSNVLRMRAFTIDPTSDTDGIVVGTQT